MTLSVVVDVGIYFIYYCVFSWSFFTGNCILMRRYACFINILFCWLLCESFVFCDFSVLSHVLSSFIVHIHICSQLVKTLITITWMRLKVGNSCGQVTGTCFIQKIYAPPLPYFKIYICPFPLPHFASIFFAYLWSFRWPNYIVTLPR